MDAIQSIIMENFPENLINPTALHNILKNFSLHLQEYYELIAGAMIENIHLYYYFITVATIRNAQHMKLILNVPLNTANRHFVLYKILALRHEFLMTRLFNVYLNIYFSALTLFSTTASCLQKQN